MSEPPEDGCNQRNLLTLKNAKMCVGGVDKINRIGPSLWAFNQVTFVLALVVPSSPYHLYLFSLPELSTHKDLR